MFWNLARAHSGAKAVLTAKQIEIMEQNRSEHDLRMKGLIRDLPGMAEDLAALWTALQLTPNQADALETVHRLIVRYVQNEQVKQHNEMRADMANILTADQLALADRFYERQIGDGAVLLQMGEERERFLEALRLTGEQKIKLVRMVLDRRARIVPSVQDVLNAAGRLREQVHAEIPDRSALMAAAAGLGNVIGQAAGVGAGLIADVKEVLTTEQTDLVRGHINSHFDQHLEHARMMPVRVHDLIDFLNELGLTPGQKDQVVTLIAERHEAQRTRHEGMKRLF
jgi:Spy/CpxP family protein refolding chaperone